MALQKRKEKGKTIITTSTGVELQVRAVSRMFIEALSAGVKIPTVPQRKAKHTVDDAVMMIDLDADVLENPEKYEPEDYRAWVEYKQALETANEEKGNRYIRGVLTKGVLNQEVIEPPEGWADEQRAMGIEIPEDEWELKKKFFEFEVVGGVLEFQHILLTIQALGGDIPEEAIDETIDSFRGQMAGEIAERASSAFHEGMDEQQVL